MNFSIPNILLITISGVNFLLGVSIHFYSRSKKANVAYTIIAYAVSAWALTNAGFRITSHYQSALIWAVLSYISAIVILTSLLYFSFVFPKESESFNKRNKYLIIISGLSMVFFTSIPNLVWKGVIIHGEQARKIITGPGILVYGSYLVWFGIWSIWNLIKKYKKASGVSKAQLKFVLWGVSLSIAGGFATNLILPIMKNYSLVWLGPILTIIMVIFFAYAILKHHLFNLRVVATELLTALLLLLFFINIFFYHNTARLAFNIIIFIGALVIGILLIRSILQEVKYRKRLERAYEKLKKLDEAKTEFISIASHQLRTPLTAIKGYISMILEGNYGEIPEKVKKPMKNVFESNERLINLVNDLLNVSRIESGKLELDLEQTSLEELISEVVEELKLQAKDKEVEIKWEPSQDLPDIRIDYDKIRQVVLNIIDNAISYTEQGEIVVEAEQKDSKIKITISDTGEGMTQQEIEHLFDRFTRGKAGNQLNTEGVGLGLYVGKKFVDLHGGEIWAESEGRGQGSTFHLTLPITPPQKHEQNTNS